MFYQLTYGEWPDKNSYMQIARLQNEKSVDEIVARLYDLKPVIRARGLRQRRYSQPIPPERKCRDTPDRHSRGCPRGTRAQRHKLRHDGSEARGLDELAG